MRNMAKKSVIFLMIAVLVCALALVSFAACNKPTETPANDTPEEKPVEPITITDMIGRQLEIKPGTYKRVVCIGAGALRMYSYIGDMNLLCGVEDIDNETLTNRPKMFDGSARPYQLAYKDLLDSIDSSCGVGGPNAQTAEAEKILSCRPDIVISEYEDVDKENALQQALGGNVPVVTVKYGPKTVFDDNVLNSFIMLGKIFNRKSRAAVLNAYIKEQKQEIFDRTKDIPEEDKKSVYICGLGNWGTTNHLMTAKNNYAPFEIAHIKNAVNLSGGGAPQAQIEEETLLSISGSIDIVIFDVAAIRNIKPLTNENKVVLERIKAWQEGEVYVEMPQYAYYVNLELALVNTWWIAKVVYPELFADIDMTEKTNEITYAFFGKELAKEIFACPNSFGGYRQIENPSQFFGQ
ncbi:MAG: ABC transporter substrate-binding protein [Clostridia bacterium]|nr:ABC transporter substrate-binding protein [Clostridia bacterium]